MAQSFTEQWLRLRSDYPGRDEGTLDWIKWMRAEGHKRRMHGVLLDSAILDIICHT